MAETDDLGIPLLDLNVGDVEGQFNALVIPTLQGLIGGASANVIVAGSGDYTVGTVPGDEKKSLLIATGALTGARALLMPVGSTAKAARRLTVWNQTTGPHALTLKRSGQSSYVGEIPQNYARRFFRDATNWYPEGPAFDPQTGNLYNVGASLPTDYISPEGIEVIWNSVNQLTVGTGTVVAENGDVITITAPLTINFTSLSGDQWGYVYVYLSGGSPAAECVATAPGSPYRGKARSKTGNTARRFVFAVKTNVSGELYRWQHGPTSGFVRWLAHVTTSPFRVLAGGTATTETEIDCSAVVPVMSRFAQVQFSNTATNIHCTFGAGSGAGDDSVAPPTTTLGNFGQNQWPVGIMALSDDQRLSYAFAGAPSGGALYVDVWGFYLDR